MTHTREEVITALNEYLEDCSNEECKELDAGLKQLIERIAARFLSRRLEPREPITHITVRGEKTPYIQEHLGEWLIRRGSGEFFTYDGRWSEWPQVWKTKQSAETVLNKLLE